MYTLNLAFKQKTKKLTLPKTINNADFYTLIRESFRLQQKVIGLTNPKGQLINFDQIQINPSSYQNDLLYLITTQDMNDDNMSFASDHGQIKKQNLSKNKKGKNWSPLRQQIQIPQKLEGFYQGVIGDLQLFEQMFLEQKQVTIVFCFVKQKPKNISFPYYLYHTAKNSAIIYYGYDRICEFFIQSMNIIPKSIQTFIQSLVPHKIAPEKQSLWKPFTKKSKPTSSKQSSQKIFNQQQVNQLNKQIIFDSSQKIDDINDNQDDIDNNSDQLQNQSQHILNNRQQGEDLEHNQSDDQEEFNPQPSEMQTSLLQNLLKLRDDGEITELQFYKMKSQLLENLSDFMRKYQMGTRKVLRKDRNQHFGEQSKQTKLTNQRAKHQQQRKYQQKAQKQQKQYQKHQKQQHQLERHTRTPQSKGVIHSAYSRDQRRIKKYQIPIIVRKYNNVIEKISTSYPLTQQQEQSINLILELELKGLISQKQSGIYKTCILQQDPQVFPLFLDYFDSLIDQLQLVSKLKKIKKINSQKKQRSQHNMRLLIKYARQGSYQLLRTLLLQKNHLVFAALDKFKSDKNVERLATRLQKIAIVYRQKGELQEDVFD